MVDDLDAPLRGKRDVRAGRARRSLPIARSMLLVLGIIAGGIAIRLLVADDPGGGRPVVEAPITSAADTNPVAVAVNKPAEIIAEPETPVDPDAPAITVLDTAADASSQGLGLPPDLVEETQYGAIPRVSGTGETPFAYYSQVPVSSEADAGKPRVAIIVTGLGLNQATTDEAIASLPGGVTLAFAPYGKTLEQTVPQARGKGHEVLLQLPMEPFDYPQSDPGPQTLLAGEPPRANLDKLYWLLARFGGYIGVMNHMGARFTAAGGDFSPIMEEVGSRGLGYIDDGSSNRSLAPQLAKTNAVPFARADMVLDSNPAPEPIMAALQALEQKAIANGSAVGVISALPVSLATLKQWAERADAATQLVPASSLMK